MQFTLFHKQNLKQLKVNKFFEEMDKAIPWEKILKEIKKYYQASSTGRPKTELELLFRIYCLQKWFNLSDPGVEEAIYDRASFQKFLDINPSVDNIPDETTILNFRHFLEKHKLQETMLKVVNEELKNKGFLLERGTITDATLIKAPSSTKNEEQKRDPEMSSTKKNNNHTFGMKIHFGVDAESGLVHSMIGTTAKVSDSEKFEELLHGKEQAVFGDRAYASDERKRKMKKAGIYYGIKDKRKRKNNQTLELSNSQKRKHKKTGSIRAKVEHLFLTIKHLWGHAKARYKGLEKNIQEWFGLAALANIHRVRYKLAC